MPEDRATALAAFREAAAETDRAFADLTEADLRVAPAGEDWNVAQIVNHVGTAHSSACAT
ncbi:MAG: DinB family protein [Chloroflexota bacterium]